MAFINEYIPEADFKKFNFEMLNKRPKETSGTTPSDSWTIDREADIWLRHFYTEMDHTDPVGGYTGIAVWDFYWRGNLMLVKLMSIDGGGGINQHCWARKKLLSMSFPSKLESHKADVLKDLEMALTAYKDGGVLSDATSFSFTLEI